MCSSPRLIAAYHDFLRLLMPRHSPCALSSLTSSEQMSLVPFPLAGKTPPAPLLLLSIANPLRWASLALEGQGQIFRNFTISTPYGSRQLSKNYAGIQRKISASCCLYPLKFPQLAVVTLTLDPLTARLPSVSDWSPGPSAHPSLRVYARAYPPRYAAFTEASFKSSLAGADLTILPVSST